MAESPLSKESVETLLLWGSLFPVALNHYVFGFQRFTLEIARRYTDVPKEHAELQGFMTPATVGATGWLAQFTAIGAAVGIGVSFSWWLTIGYGMVWFLVPAILPLLPLRRHYAGLAYQELERNRTRTWMTDPELSAFLGVLMMRVADEGALDSPATQTDTTSPEDTPSAFIHRCESCGAQNRIRADRLESHDARCGSCGATLTLDPQRS